MDRTGALQFVCLITALLVSTGCNDSDNQQTSGTSALSIGIRLDTLALTNTGDFRVRYRIATSLHWGRVDEIYIYDCSCDTCGISPGETVYQPFAEIPGYYQERSCTNPDTTMVRIYWWGCPPGIDYRDIVVNRQDVGLSPDVRTPPLELAERNAGQCSGCGNITLIKRNPDHTDYFVLTIDTNTLGYTGQAKAFELPRDSAILGMVYEHYSFGDDSLAWVCISHCNVGMCNPPTADTWVLERGDVLVWYSEPDTGYTIPTYRATATGTNLEFRRIGDNSLACLDSIVFDTVSVGWLPD